jgi:hypothetical protein
MDQDNYTKKITNSISYNINKKMLGYTKKIDIIYDKIDKNENMLFKIIELLHNNNQYLENKINNLEDKIYVLQTTTINKLLENNELPNTNLSLNENKLYRNNEISQNNELLLDKNELLFENNIVYEENNDILTKNDNHYVNNKLNDKILKNRLKNNDKNQEQNNFKELKIEKFDIDDNFIKNCLSESNIESDLKIFKKIYIDNVAKEFYPIRHIKKKYQYWLHGEMKDDDKNGSYIKNTIIKNIELCYTSVNTLDNYVDIDIFLKNQDYINIINDEKYKDNFLIRISEIIKI